MANESLDAKWNKILTSVVTVFGSLILALTGYLGYDILDRMSSLEDALQARTREYDKSIAYSERWNMNQDQDIQNLIAALQSVAEDK